MTRVVVCMAAWACAATAAAQSEPTPEQVEEARAQFDRGTLAYEAGDYAVAEAAFQAAYDLTRHPDLLYNIYTAAERNGDTELAIESLEGYLEGGEMEGARRSALEARLERLRLRLDRERRDAAAREQQLADRDQQLSEEQAERQSAEAQAAEARARHLEGVRAGHQASDTLTAIGLGALIGGGVAAALFGTFAGLSEGEDQSLSSACGVDARRTCTEADVEALRQWNLAADVSWITAAGLGAVGLTILMIGVATRPSEPGDVAVRPVIAPTRAGLVAEGRF